MTILLTFGSVFRYEEEDYVYLAYTDEIVYTAKILAKGDSDTIQTLFKTQSRNPRVGNTIKSNVLYCYVELQTKEFEGRIAHLGKTESSPPSFAPQESRLRLDKNDILQIKKEILEGAVPLLLKDLVREIDIL